MGVIIKWKLPDTGEVSYDKTYIYKSDSESGTYTELASQLIADNTYFDADGDTSSWYKIKFYATAIGTWSAESDAIQGGKTIGYCSPDDVRNLTNISSSDLTDTQIYEMIQLATAELNSNINTNVFRERIDYLDETRENKTDGSNTTYYIKRWAGHCIADLDNDGDVDTSDITVHAVYSDGTETTATVDTITPDSGYFTLSTAYSNSYKLYVTYSYSNVSENTPHSLVKWACSLLTAAYCFAKINWGRAPNVSFGNLKIYRHMESFDRFYKLFQRAVERINTSSAVGGGIGGDYSEGEIFVK